ncbi:Protein KTI12-like protein [Armadillidium vulgare]|nr:Protein KTI12-like protein [Armadillidium vulgare]RXG69121.1 Protein KTI12-like protein [Armadillidium vulgare]
MRYEPPDSRNRWDFPMFGVLPDEPLPFENIYGALYDRKPPPPNQSTQLQPLTSNNFVHELDKCTQEVISFIMNSQKVNAEGEIKIPGVTEVLLLPRKLSLAELSRHRRQFTTYSKSHPVKEASKAKTLFIQYLNKTVE